MRKLSLILVIFSLLTNASNASTYSTEPQQFINELAKDLIDKLSDKNLTKEQKEIFIEKIGYIDKIISPSDPCLIIKIFFIYFFESNFLYNFKVFLHIMLVK